MCASKTQPPPLPPLPSSAAFLCALYIHSNFVMLHRLSDTLSASVCLFALSDEGHFNVSAASSAGHAFYCRVYWCLPYNFSRFLLHSIFSWSLLYSSRETTQHACSVGHMHNLAASILSYDFSAAALSSRRKATNWIWITRHKKTISKTKRCDIRCAVKKNTNTRLLKI